MTRKFTNRIPVLLIASRAFLGVIIIVLSTIGGNMLRLNAVLILMAILTDIFDGIIARKLGISSDQLRRADSQIDVFFWLCVLASSYIAYKPVISENLSFISAILVIEVSGYLISFLRFKKEPCVHSWCSKLWNINLTIAFILLYFNGNTSMLKPAFIHGIVALSEVILILFILPKWDRDIPSFIHAIWIRQGRKFKKYRLLNG